MKNKLSFWHGRRVFLTGHTGFKGSWMALALQQAGAVVTGYALDPPTNPSLFEQANVGLAMTSLTGDIRDLERLSRRLAAARPEIIFHLAAQALVRESYRRPVDTYQTNVIGTLNVLEAARTVPSIRAIVVITTDKCYENTGAQQGYRETDRLGGHDPYSSSKACAELVCDAYRRSFFNPERFEEHRIALATARAGNVIGGGDWAADRLVPDCIRAFMSGHPAVIRNPQHIRPWQHVLEPIAGYLLLGRALLLDPLSFSGAWNFGPRPEDCRPVSAVVSELAKCWGDGAQCSLANGERPALSSGLEQVAEKADSIVRMLSTGSGAAEPEAKNRIEMPESSVLTLDSGKSQKLLGWHPMWPLDEALRRTLEVYRAAASDSRCLSGYIAQQIGCYFDRASEEDFEQEAHSGA